MIDANDLAEMRAELADFMQDTCVIQTYTEGSKNSLGEVPISYTDGSAIACDYSPGGGSEKNRETGTVWVRQASVKIGLSNTVTVRDRIKVTHLKGTALSSALVYGIGNVRRHNSALAVDLEKAE